MKNVNSCRFYIIYFNINILNVVNEIANKVLFMNLPVTKRIIIMELLKILEIL